MFAWQRDREGDDKLCRASKFRATHPRRAAPIKPTPGLSGPSRFILYMMHVTKKPPPTLEQALKEGDERRERELAQDDEPRTAEDKILEDLKRPQTEVPDYDKL
jgi:hypothetical protein